MGRPIQSAKNPLRKLSKLELLELLARQERELQSLRASLAETEAQLADRDLKVRESGSIAEAALKLSGIFEAAQQAADRYLENVKARGGRDAPPAWQGHRPTEGER